MASDLTARVLDALSSHEGPVQTADAFPSESYTSIKSALDKLRSRDMISYETIEREDSILSAEAKSIVSDGSHEAKVFEAVRQAVNGLKIADLPGLVGKDSAKIGQGKAFAAKWIRKDEKDKNLLRASTDSVVDTTREQLRTIQETRTHPDGKVLQDLRKRKLIAPQKVITFEARRGPKFAREFVKEETDLTAEMLATGAWKTAQLKPYNFQAKGAPTPSGALHPLNKVRHEFRQIFFEMGFREMPSNRFVETGFWNFDALFVPQQHPARDVQDTFFISDPAVADPPRAEPGDDDEAPSGKKLDYEKYFADVRAVHQDGAFGSIGYRYPWSVDEARRLVLRTHTTATSAHVLHRLAADPRPARYFSIDRVFRNETVDATHLAEFHQVEGVIAEWGLTLGGLIGFMEVFFAKMGIHGLRFKPAYNPYTEPSLEIFGYHKGLGKWVEIGNSGMFRPEMLEPMGLPKDLRVYGWGLSLERPTMIKYGVNNIRELLGHKVDLGFVESNAAVRLDKD